LLSEQLLKGRLFGVNLDHRRAHGFPEISRLIPEAENGLGLIHHLVGFLAAVSNLQERFGVRGRNGVEQRHQAFPNVLMD
jgi:hypothetical protein